MRWQGDIHPSEEATIRPNRPGILPVVIRSQKVTMINQTPIEAGIPYLTEASFLIHHSAIVQLNVGYRDISVIIETQDNKVAKRQFKLIVPPDSRESMRLERC
jgi:hypothetical protein